MKATIKGPLQYANKNTGVLPCQTLIEHAMIGLGLSKLTSEVARVRRRAKLPILLEGEWCSYIDSFVEIDYRVWTPGSRFPLLIDTKDKRKFFPTNWGLPDDQVDCWFLADETATKKLSNSGSRGFIIYNVYGDKTLYVWTSQSLSLSHKKWAMRICDDKETKYKLLLHVSGAIVFTSWERLFDWISNWANSLAKELASSGSRHTYFAKGVDSLSVNTQRRTLKFREEDLIRQGGDITNEG